MIDKSDLIEQIKKHSRFVRYSNITETNYYEYPEQAITQVKQLCIESDDAREYWNKHYEDEVVEEVEKIEAIEREYYIKGYDAGKAIQWQHFIEQACEGGWTNKGMPPKDVPVLMVRTGSEQIPKWKWKPLDCSFKQAIRDRFEGEKFSE